MKFEDMVMTPFLAEEIMTAGNYIMTSRGFYQVFYSKNAGFYALLIGSHPYIVEGYKIVAAREVNVLAGWNLVREENYHDKV